MKLPWTDEKLKQVLEKYRYVFLVLAVGLILLVLPTGTSEETETAPVAAQASADTEAWLAQQEQRLAQALSSIEGVGETKVVLTLESGPQSVLAADGLGEEQETVIVSAGSGYQETVTIQELSPKLQGALVICQGGGNANIKLQVLQAMEALTGLNANQISICKGMGGT